MLQSLYNSFSSDSKGCYTKKREPNCHTLEDGRRKPKDEDVGIAAHAMRENRLPPCIFKKISYVFFYK